MRRAAALVLALALPLPGCSGGAPTSATSTTSAEPSPRARPTPSPSPSSTAHPSAEQQVAATLDGMSRREQIAQLFVVGVPLDDIGQGDGLAGEGVGGLFLAGRSQLSTDRLAGITAAWQKAAGATGLWVAVDQEGGNVQTLSGAGFPELPTAREQGRLPEAQLQDLAGGMGASLSDAGINLDLAPVADVVPAGTEEQNAPIGAFGREYGSTAAEVGPAVETVVAGLHEHGVTATLKHFPGLGRVRDNTDTSGQVVDTVTKPDDAQVQLFGELARSDAAPFVMTSSAVYRGIDDTQPAGWSEEVVDHLLRGELGFDGVVISDDVGRAAAVQEVPPGERAIRCLQAGGTLVLTVDPSLFPQMLAAVADRDRTDDAFSRRIDAAVHTALLAKAEAGLLGP